MTTDLSSREALQRILEVGVQPILEPAGFEQVGKLSWVRHTDELQHVIALLVRRGMYDVQWGIVSLETTPILWGHEGVEGDVSLAIVGGTPASIRHPARGQSFRIDKANDIYAVDVIAGLLSQDMQVVENRLRQFRTRRNLREYLLLNRDPKDRRDFVIPANLPLKLTTAAALAIADRDGEACELVAEAEQAMAPYRDELSRSRIRRLRAAASGLRLMT